jgi:hypothetical protein
MTRRISALLVVAACGPAHPPALVPQIQPGPAAAAKPHRVLVLEAACGSVEYHCPADFARTVDGIVRGGLEFAGYTVVESESLRLQTRQRHVEQTSSTSGESSHGVSHTEGNILPFGDTTTSDGTHESHSESETTILDGPGFEDLTVDERQAVMDKAGSDAVVTVRIVVGGTTGVWRPNQNVEVMLKLGVDRGDAMAWATRCTASSNDFSTVTAALENAARCAVSGAIPK